MGGCWLFVDDLFSSGCLCGCLWVLLPPFPPLIGCALCVLGCKLGWSFAASACLCCEGAGALVQCPSDGRVSACEAGCLLVYQLWVFGSGGFVVVLSRVG